MQISYYQDNTLSLDLKRIIKGLRNYLKTLSFADKPSVDLN